ncbi:MAG: translation initiation factor [Opitutaceae bacterium]|nr:translation initiation factor [Opitutaceae bacterium]
MNPRQRIPVEGGPNLKQSPFAALSRHGGPPGLPVAASDSVARSKVGPNVAPPAPEKNRGRVDILRETGNRGGKTVTVITGFTGIGQPEKEQLARKMRAACGCGGTVKEGRIEIQGDQRETVAGILLEAGFRPVFAGG